jgi:radical SAM protein with 4Fe4S-binding SPASM domain
MDELTRQMQLVRDAVDAVTRPTMDCRTCGVRLPQPAPLAMRAHAPYKADLALHYACNNRCSHCYNEPGRKQMPSLRLAGWRAVLDRLYQIGVPYIIFTGGEPTIHPALVELVDYAERLGQLTGVNTNGRRLADRELTQGLVDAGLDHVQVTLNSNRPAPHNEIVGADAFDQTIRGIETSLECGLHTLTNTTLVSDNVDDAIEIVEFLYALGLRTFAMNGMIYSGCGARHPAALEDYQVAPVLERVRDRASELGMNFLWYTPTRYCRMSPPELGLGIRTCNAAEYSICIEPNGDVLPCQSYYETAGNLLDDPWESIWESELFASFRYRREQPEQCGLPDECTRCEHLALCGGGCPLERREHE